MPCACHDLLLLLDACRNDNQVNNRKVVLLSKQGDGSQQQEVCWKDVVAGDLIKVIAGCCHTTQQYSTAAKQNGSSGMCFFVCVQQLALRGLGPG
jgi:hypothetical protein